MTAIDPRTANGLRSVRFRNTLLGRVLKDPRGAFGIAIVFLVILATAVSPLFDEAARTPDTTAILASPSWSHLLGTDEIGRDILARIITGSRVVLQVIAVSVGSALVLGTAIGLISGYRGGAVDAVIMRIVDAMLAFPLLVLALTIVAALGSGLHNALIAITAVVTPRIARVVRGEVLSLRTREWVDASRIIGLPTFRVLLRHVLPHLMGTLLVFVALQASTAILAEASLSFLGLGIQPPEASWGAMVSAGASNLYRSWALGVFPGLAILLVVTALNLLSDALGQALRDTEPTDP
ncbi:ABC transporter permease [Microbacterium esteraromaticum]|uniref:ABC transporter permease n=1 Tax=Microbacterium esteraromaticum TaxID=57043 RepID=A0A7D7WHF6_9MICO|nr:ABC transporter permease [Microbacterium esteraromaticum]QMU96470.1 ABC transporter permease [Microbacterium esteraromaticum]